MSLKIKCLKRMTHYTKRTYFLVLFNFVVVVVAEKITTSESNPSILYFNNLIVINQSIVSIL